VSCVQRAVMAASTSGTLIASMQAGLPRADVTAQLTELTKIVFGAANNAKLF
jgi:hypothetical protein